MVANPKLKRLPTNDEKEFIGIIRKIRNQTITSSEKISGGMAPHLREIAIALLDARKDYDLDGFWDAYDALTKNYAQLKDWRKLVATDDENATPERSQGHGQLLSDVKPEKMQWLWKNGFALGKITMIDGDPGLGKSLIGADLSARVTTGREMPDGSPCMAKGGVVIIMPEDGIADTIQPRFARAGAVLNQVSSIGTILSTDEDGNTIERPFSLPGDIPILEQEIDRVKATLVYIDPLMSIIGGDKNTYKDNEVRALLYPLKQVAENKKVAMVFVRHLTKSRGDNPLMAGGGSIAFIGLARGGFVVVRDPEEEGTVIFAQVKSNISCDTSINLKYRITDDKENDDERPYIQWMGTSSIERSELMSQPKKNTGSNRQQILSLLRGCTDGMEIPEIQQAMPGIGESNLKMTLKRMYESGEISKSERGVYHAK